MLTRCCTSQSHVLQQQQHRHYICTLGSVCSLIGESRLSSRASLTDSLPFLT